MKEILICSVSFVRDRYSGCSDYCSARLQQLNELNSIQLSSRGSQSIVIIPLQIFQPTRNSL